MIPVRTLRIAAGAEAVSLAILLGNLLSTHTQAIAALLGPLRGTAYLVVIAATWMIPSVTPPGARWRVLIPWSTGAACRRGSAAWMWWTWPAGGGVTTG
ncbi:DUF3817 domain-containing protein [Streptomyces sp. 8N706]|uniref:DUF3817 domain-containing protein n=1 Tax=Streptomyces sp. 8N706 TaxID=3457416 RepID=UPI003FD01A05